MSGHPLQLSIIHYSHCCPGCGNLIICRSVDLLGNHWGDCVDCGQEQLLVIALREDAPAN